MLIGLSPGKIKQARSRSKRWLDINLEGKNLSSIKHVGKIRAEKNFVTKFQDKNFATNFVTKNYTGGGRLGAGRWCLKNSF